MFGWPLAHGLPAQQSLQVDMPARASSCLCAPCTRTAPLGTNPGQTRDTAHPRLHSLFQIDPWCFVNKKSWFIIHSFININLQFYNWRNFITKGYYEWKQMEILSIFLQFQCYLSTPTQKGSLYWLIIKLISTQAENKARKQLQY